MAKKPVCLDAAIKEFHAGNLDEAKRLIQQLLKIDANNAEAYHLMGVIAHRTGYLADSLSFLLDSCCKVLVVNGGTGFLEVGFFSIFTTFE